jgi:hypothetical protein
VNTNERGAPPSRPQAPPAGPRGPRRLPPPRDSAPPAGGSPGSAGDSPPAGKSAAAGGSPDRAGGSAAAGGSPRPAGSSRRAILGGATPSSRGPRRLAPPRAVKVRADATGRPEAIGNRGVEAVRESWLVEDRWWTDAPLRRRYWEVVTADGRDLVVFRDLEGGRWFAQR